ncbi:MAG: hypothetical protein QNJ37_15605 [Crocosphaera sp.]|nr:hypothetical protein [Crocosphaera sp.]
MTQEPITVRYTLEDILKDITEKLDTRLDKIEQKMDKQYTELNQKMDKQYTELNQKMDRQYTELNQKIDKLETDVNDIKIGQARLEEKVTGEIKTLDAKIDGITKRLDFQEFINRGVVLGLIVAILGGVAKMLGWIGT